MNNSNYINVVYDEKKKPFSLYPALLIKYLGKKYNLKKN